MTEKRSVLCFTRSRHARPMQRRTIQLTARRLARRQARKSNAKREAAAHLPLAIDAAASQSVAGEVAL